MRVWSDSGYQQATLYNLRVWKDDDTEPSTSSEELILGDAKLRKVARVMAKAWVLSESLDVGSYVVHIKDVDSSRSVDVTINVVQQKLITWE